MDKPNIDECKYLNSDDKSIFIKEKTLHFKDWEFECFEWNYDGIKKPCNVDTIISEKKHAFALSTELSTDCQALSSSYSVVKCVKFINCTFKSEPDIEKMGLNLITFEECIFQDMKTYLPKHLLVKSNEIGKSDERRKIRFVNCEFDTC